MPWYYFLIPLLGALVGGIIGGHYYRQYNSRKSR